MTSIVESILYTLKWDENGLRDKTLAEIKKDSVHEIRCPCLNRRYNITTGSIIKHLDSKAHKEWVKKQQNEHIQEFGSCCSPEQTTIFLLKENRELKKLIVKLTNQNKIYEDTISNFKRNISEFSLKSSIEKCDLI
jgi:hypothetical protein